MNAIKFIKEHGVDRARGVVEGKKDTVAPNLFKYFSPSLNDYHMLNIESNVRISELKRLIESFDLINSLGGVQEATNKAFDMTMLVVGFNPDKIEQAIADYEQLFGNSETLGCEE